jgi:hypothetical protein
VNPHANRSNPIVKLAEQIASCLADVAGYSDLRADNIEYWIFSLPINET